MKFRSSLLLACMVTVPSLAMFSHRIPPELRASMRRTVGAVVARLSAAVTAAPRQPAAPAPPPAAPVAVAIPASAATGRESLERSGAVAIECRPLPGDGGGHLASCRVPVDAAGQLHRVFQAHGPDPDAATGALAAAVSSWTGRPRTATLAADAPRQ